MDSKSLIEEFTNQKNKLSNARIIILHGNSIIACIIKVVLKELGFSSNVVIFDNGRFLSKCEVKISNENTAVILCSSRSSTRKSMKRDAKKYFPDVEVFDFFAIYYYWLTNIIKRKCDYEELAKTLVLCREDKCIPNIDSINTFFCNLKCKECSNGIQYRKEKRKISADSQIYYLKKMTDKLPISQCNFQGGEVFTDVNFSEFVEKHSYNSRVAIFTVATNGTILPKDDVFEVIRNTGCMIRISDYGILSKHKQDIIEKCKEFNIPCFTFPMAEKWRKFGEYKKRNRSESELREICSRCCFGTHDLMFVDNKIYCCLRTLYANAVGDNHDAVIANTLGLDSEFTLKDLENFISGKELWRMCDYCNDYMEIIEPAEQL